MPPRKRVAAAIEDEPQDEQQEPEAPAEHAERADAAQARRDAVESAPDSPQVRALRLERQGYVQRVQLGHTQYQARIDAVDEQIRYWESQR